MALWWASTVRMEWEAEPNALGFYERMGGRYLRDSDPRSKWGRTLRRHVCGSPPHVSLKAAG